MKCPICKTALELWVYPKDSAVRGARCIPCDQAWGSDRLVVIYEELFQQTQRQMKNILRGMTFEDGDMEAEDVRSGSMAE